MNLIKYGIIAATFIYNGVVFATPHSTINVDVQKELETQLELNLAQLRQPNPQHQVEVLIRHLDQQVNHQMIIAEAGLQFPTKQFKVEFSD